MKNKKILLGLFLLLFCFLLVGCDYLEQQKFIKKNINKFERKCKSQYGDDAVLYNVKAFMTGNGDTIGMNRKVGKFLFGIIKDSNGDVKKVKYNTQTDILYSDEKERLTKDATEKMELSGVKSIYNTILDVNGDCYFQNGDNIEFEKLAQVDNLKRGPDSYRDDIIVIFLTDKFNQDLSDNTVIKELFENNTNNYSILAAIVEYDGKSDDIEEHVFNKWFGLIKDLKQEERNNSVKFYWDNAVEYEKPSVLNRMVVYDNLDNDNKTEYKIKEYNNKQSIISKKSELSSDFFYNNVSTYKLASNI